jgi:uncharacterized membrane protein
MRTRTLRTVIYLAAGIGLIVSIFAALEYFEASLQGLCTINSFFSCSTVDASGKTTTLGIPDYLIGIGGFILILVIAGLAESRRSDRRWPIVLLGVTSLGVAFSVYFLYVQLALIGAFCVVCASADAFGWLAWAGALALVARTRTVREDGPAETSASASSEP